MVEGGRRQRTDSGGYTIGIRHHPRCCDPHDPQSLFAQGSKPYIVTGRPIAHIMCRAIDLDHQSGFSAIEVHDIRPDWMLAAEFRACLAATQSLPQRCFGWGKVTP